MKKRSKWCLIGIPDHEGVFHVGGRLGAALGPSEFRKVFSRFKGLDGVQDSLAFDRDLPTGHRQAADAIRELHRTYPFSVVIGGGNDHSYTQLLGIQEAFNGKLQKTKNKFQLGCINIDAHFDLRKPGAHISSGSPFYVSIEEGILDPKNFVEFGIQRHCNAPELWAYAQKKKIEIIPIEKLRHGKALAQFKASLKKLTRRCDTVVISLDLDAVNSAEAPGVSAPQAEGLSSTDILEIAEHAGRIPEVVSLGIFELNPEHDIDQRTSRLAATAAYHFVSEALKRKPQAL